MNREGELLQGCTVCLPPPAVTHHLTGSLPPPQVLAELQLIAIMLRSQFGPATVDEENQAVELQVCVNVTAFIYALCTCAACLYCCACTECVWAAGA